jgi:hypothetical protein
MRAAFPEPMHDLWANVLNYRGRPQDAIPLAKQAIRLSPVLVRWLRRASRIGGDETLQLLRPVEYKVKLAGIRIPPQVDHREMLSVGREVVVLVAGRSQVVAATGELSRGFGAKPGLGLDVDREGPIARPVEEFTALGGVRLSCLRDSPCSLLRPSVPCRSIPTRAILAGKRDATREAAREERQAIRTSAWGTRRVLAELAQFTTLAGGMKSDEAGKPLFQPQPQASRLPDSILRGMW